MTKRTLECKNFNLHIFKDDFDRLSISLAPTKDQVYPPTSREELKNIADFINKYLENK